MKIPQCKYLPHLPHIEVLNGLWLFFISYIGIFVTSAATFIELLDFVRVPTLVYQTLGGAPHIGFSETTSHKVSSPSVSMYMSSFSHMLHEILHVPIRTHIGFAPWSLHKLIPPVCDLLTRLCHFGKMSMVL